MGIRHLIVFFWTFILTLQMALSAPEAMTKFYDFEILSALPQQHEDYVIYIASKTDFTAEAEVELLSEFFLDGNAVAAETLSPKLWSVTATAPSAHGVHNLRARLYLKLYKLTSGASEAQVLLNSKDGYLYLAEEDKGMKLYNWKPASCSKDTLSRKFWEGCFKSEPVLNVKME